MRKSQKIAIIIFTSFFVANLFFWNYSRFIRSSWANVPPVPEAQTDSLMTLGDKQTAYRVNAMMLQNLGNTGGEYKSLKDYDYADLQKWLFLQDKLDPVSDVMPMMAAYYFGGVQDKERRAYIIDYLEAAGDKPYGQKWRWLAHAVYMARHEQEDLDRALELAYKLASNPNPHLGDWARQMPVFVLEERGEEDLAYDIMLNILLDNVETMHPNEINYMYHYLCDIITEDRPDLYNKKLCSQHEER